MILLLWQGHVGLILSWLQGGPWNFSFVVKLRLSSGFCQYQNLSFRMQNKKCLLNISITKLRKYVHLVNGVNEGGAFLVWTKDYKLRGLDTRQRRPQKWRYKPNYSILTQVFLDLPQLLQSSTDRAEYRQTKHINQCSRHTFQSVFIDYPRQLHIHTGSDFSQLWIVCFVLKPRLRKS